MNTAASGGASAGAAIIWAIVILVSIGLYWSPTIVALARHLPHIGPTVIMNIFAFAVVPWWLALMMAVRTPPRPQFLYAPPAPPLPPGPPQQM